MTNDALVEILSERDLIRRSFVIGVATIDGGFRHLPIVAADGAPVAMVLMRDIPTEYRLMVERCRFYMAPALAAQ